MIGNNVVGIIFSNMHDEHLHDLTTVRTMGSVPFGGRYRTIDFPLSSMVNSGISKVGVVTKSNYQSLMDHLGSGKAWDLSRKTQGLYILPPFGFGEVLYHSRLEVLMGITNFLEHCKEDYVVMSDCHVIYSMDFTPVIKQHVEKDADVTIVYKNSVMPADHPEPLRLEVGRSRKVTQVLFGVNTEDKSNWGIGVFVMKRQFLLDLVHGAKELGMRSFARDVIQESVGRDYRVYGYKHEGFAGVLGSIKGYFEQNMELMNKKVRADLFRPDFPIYTKERDEMPTRFGLGSRVVNSLISDGCVIEGEVENCILSRGVRVGKGAHLRNCIIMQDNIIGDNTTLNYVISDKDVTFGNGRSMMGHSSYPVYVAKGKNV
ncbi:MAG: glucose-1-phosphate adenylyltransferase subunit GlgD [Clostridia bacterium]|nr:glucose-1-phosphate adenylyltransferase subunit GlgD [Clostridia bacterium]